MATFIITCKNTGTETMVESDSIKSVYADLKKHAGEHVKDFRVYPANYCHLAIQVARKVAEKVLQYMENDTQVSILRAFDRVGSDVNSFVKAGQYTTDSELDEYVAGKVATMYSHAQDYFSVAYMGLLECDSTLYADKAKNAFKQLNHYIQTLRTQNTHDVLTAFDTDTGKATNTELRKMIVGLTGREEKEGETVKNTELARAIVATAKECTPTQKKVMQYLGKGLSTKKTAEKMGVSRQAIMKHRMYIGKKLLAHDIVWEYVTSPEK